MAATATNACDDGGSCSSPDLRFFVGVLDTSDAALDAMTCAEHRGLPTRSASLSQIASMAWRWCRSQARAIDLTNTPSPRRGIAEPPPRPRDGINENGLENDS